MTGKSTNFEKMLKGYLGFLTGTGKSLRTISSYRGDLLVLQEFLTKYKIAFVDVTAKDFDAFHYFLQKKGLKTNTRRRKLITARSLYRYALSRKKISFSPAKFIKPPDRLERLPWIPNAKQVNVFLETILPRTQLSKRNRLLVEILAETGISISELCSIAWEDVQGRSLKILGKKKREFKLSTTLAAELKAWHKDNKGKYIFPGFNRHGISTAKMTPRGVEIQFKYLAKQAALKQMKPKSLRHFVVAKWLQEKVEDEEILSRLGVSKNYSLDAYKKLLER